LVTRLDNKTKRIAGLLIAIAVIAFAASTKSVASPLRIIKVLAIETDGTADDVVFDAFTQSSVREGLSCERPLMGPRYHQQTCNFPGYDREYPRGPRLRLEHIWVDKPDPVLRVLLINEYSVDDDEKLLAVASRIFEQLRVRTRDRPGVHGIR
jgi:hypothetical protein